MQGPLILNRYRPLEKKGQGGSGTVDICWDTRIQRRVAIKRLSLSDPFNAGSISGLAEARTAAMLNHPSIVSVFDFETSGDEAFIIMEAIEGPTLSQLLEDNPDGMLDLDVVSAITMAIGDALAFAHENQVLHLDIKPDNILITRTGHVKVSDFGISELAGIEGFGQALGGTIGYMPPEQMMGQDLDQRCDGFAFATLVYEMLTGLNPFDSPDIDSSLKLIRRFDVIAPSVTRTDIDPQLDEVVLSAMAPDREERFETIVDFMDAIAPFLGNPDEGGAKLRELVELDDEQAEEDDQLTHEVGLWDRIPPRARLIAGRAVSAALCWWITALGVESLGLVDAPTALLVSLIVAFAAALAPQLGSLLALGSMGVCLLYNPGSIPLLGITLLIILIIWWILFGRRSVGDVNCPLAVIPLGLIGFTPLAPLIAGFCLTPKRAFGAGMMSGLLAMVMAIGTASGSLLGFNLALTGTSSQAVLFQTIVSSPIPWITTISWGLASLAMSALCSRSTKASCILAACSAAIIILVGQTFIQWITRSIWGIPDFTWTISVILAAVVMIVIGALGAPYRGEEEG